MAMHGEDRLVRVGHPLDDLANGLCELVGNRITDGFGNIDGPRAGVDRLLDDPTQEVDLGTTAFLAGQLDILTPFASALDRPYSRFDHLLELQAQLVFHVY